LEIVLLFQSRNAEYRGFKKSNALGIDEKKDEVEAFTGMEEIV
jgi:hypothetical protein